MSAAVRARDWTRALEEKEARRRGLSVKDARAVVARKIGATVAALEHVGRGRAKRITVDLFARLRSLIIDELQREITAAQHEIEIARKAGLDGDCPEMAALEAGAAAARRLMGREP
jgi:hypothetical protein